MSRRPKWQRRPTSWARSSVVDAATGENAAHEGKLSVSFSVDKRYEGESVWMVHRKADGSLETAKVAVENGLASMTVDELSPFAVFEQKAAGPADEDGNKPGGSPSDGNGAPSSGEPDGEEPSGDSPSATAKPRFMWSISRRTPRWRPRRRSPPPATARRHPLPSRWR